MGSHRQYSRDEVESFKEKIINELSKGKSLLAILRKHKELPSRRYVYQWLNPNNSKYDQEFGNNYIQAREDSADLDAEKIEKIVDDVRNDKLRPDQARVMGDLLKWTAGRKKPKKYGDRIDVTTAGKELAQQVTIFKLPSNGRDEDGAED